MSVSTLLETPRQAGGRVWTRAWSPCLHVFTAFMAISFGVKGMYFLMSDDVEFVQHRFPRNSEIQFYVGLAMLIAFLYTVFVWVCYRLAKKFFTSTSHEDPWVEFPLFDYALVLVAIVLMGWFFVERGEDIREKLTTGTVLYRNMMPNGEDYATGDYGVSSLFAQVRGGLFIVLLTYSVLRRKYLLGFIALAYFAFAIVVSDGSRFALVGSVAVAPILMYLVHLRRDAHYRPLVGSIYGLVLALPVLAAPLLALRSQNALLANADFYHSQIKGAADTFDGLDHLTNYLYVLPIDWTGTRAMQEFWKFVPRKLWYDKPSIFGELALQEVLYPRTVGGGGRYLFLGHYPLSCVVNAIDFLGPIGFLVHGFGTGAMLAWVDSLLRRRTTVALSIVAFYFLTSYHLVRTGFENYVIGAVSPCLMPLALFGAATYAAKSLRRLSSRSIPTEGGPSIAT
jgi:hypothetical protein